VLDGVPLGVEDGLVVGVRLIVGVNVGVRVGVVVCVSVNVGVPVGVRVGEVVGVCVRVGVLVGVALGVLLGLVVGVRLIVGLELGVLVGVAVGVKEPVGLVVGVRVGAMIWPSPQTHGSGASPPHTSTPARSKAAHSFVKAEVPPKLGPRVNVQFAHGVPSGWFCAMSQSNPNRTMLQGGTPVVSQSASTVQDSTPLEQTFPRVKLSSLPPELQAAVSKAAPRVQSVIGLMLTFAPNWIS
jgi:hypothetical protein